MNSITVSVFLLSIRLLCDVPQMFTGLLELGCSEAFFLTLVLLVWTVCKNFIANYFFLHVWLISLLQFLSCSVDITVKFQIVASEFVT